MMSMACHLFGAKPFFNQCGLFLIEHWGQNFNVIRVKIKQFSCKNESENVACKVATTLSLITVSIYLS